MYYFPLSISRIPSIWLPNPKPSLAYPKPFVYLNVPMQHMIGRLTSFQFGNGNMRAVSKSYIYRCWRSQSLNVFHYIPFVLFLLHYTIVTLQKWDGRVCFHISTFWDTLHSNQHPVHLLQFNLEMHNILSAILVWADKWSFLISPIIKSAWYIKPDKL